MPISLIAPPPTAFDAQGKVDLSQVGKLASHLSRTGVEGVFICGSTGEGMSLTVSERMEIAEAWADVAPECGLKTIAQVGANSQRDAIDLARHAARLGIDAISAHAPSYFRPQSVSSMIRFFAPVAAGAGDIPFYFYDIPSLTGVSLPTSRFLVEALPQIPNLTGVKYSNHDLAQLQECLRVNEGRFQVYFGYDEALMAGYVLGASGAIGSTYNFMAPLAYQIVQACDVGRMERARTLQARVVTIVSILSEYGYLAAAKGLMEVFDIDMGTVRAPLRVLSRRQKREMIDRVRETGFPFAASEQTHESHSGNVGGPHLGANESAAKGRTT